ncbi:MAG: hypothetical protein AMK72_15395 [Planctomycetes bacterium SM23_25]|nr:MAG: hypothetical protein AMK72_15395 [Planctomycetes bacterium SM23_25]
MKKGSDDSPNTSRNTSDPVREYKVWELQQHADRILASTFPSGFIIPIEIENVAYSLGLDINPVPGLSSALQVLGALWRDHEGRYWIVVDEHLMDYGENRYRFTVAEEIAHFVLHREPLEKAVDIHGAVGLQRLLAGRYTYFEANARRLAAGLLMPREPLHPDVATAYAQVVKVVGFRNLGAVTRQVTDILRRKYVVSYEAMQYRLKEHQFRAYAAMEQAFRTRSATLWESQ